MKSIIKIVISTLLIFIGFTTYSYAQENCVIPPQLPYESNKSCVGASYSGTYDLLDPCYQKYLSIKNDYYLKCKSYWDSKNTSIVPTVVTQVKEVIREVIVTPTATQIPQRTYYVATPTDEPIPTLRPNSITPSEDNYYDDSSKNKVEKKSIVSTLISNIVSFFSNIFSGKK